MSDRACRIALWLIFSPIGAGVVGCVILNAVHRPPARARTVLAASDPLARPDVRYNTAHPDFFEPDIGIYSRAERNPAVRVWPMGLAGVLSASGVLGLPLWALREASRAT